MAVADWFDRLQQMSTAELEAEEAAPRHRREVHWFLAIRYHAAGRTTDARSACNEYLRRLPSGDPASRAAAHQFLAELDRKAGDVAAAKKRFVRAALHYRRAASTSRVPAYAAQLLLQSAENAVAGDEWTLARPVLAQLARSKWGHLFEESLDGLRARIPPSAPSTRRISRKRQRA